MYKLVAIDIDDTLFTRRLEVTDGTKHALEKAREAGTIITLSTGRMYASARPIALQLGMNLPIITYQGALVKNTMDEQVLFERHVPEHAASRILELAKELDVHVQIYYQDELYAPKLDTKIEMYASYAHVPFIVDKHFERFAHLPLTKILIIEDPETLNRITPIFEQELASSVYITKSKPNFLEFMNLEASKGNAVRFLADCFGCSLAETIAIGDSWNDLDMIQVAGLGVAMGNAIEPLKQAADFITRTNDEEGVRYVIERFVLNGTTVH